MFSGFLDIMTALSDGLQHDIVSLRLLEVGNEPATTKISIWSVQDALWCMKDFHLQSRKIKEAHDETGGTIQCKRFSSAGNMLSSIQNGIFCHFQPDFWANRTASGDSRDGEMQKAKRSDHRSHREHLQRNKPPEPRMHAARRMFEGIRDALNHSSGKQAPQRMV